MVVEEKYYNFVIVINIPVRVLKPSLLGNFPCRRGN
jgi:hypothetical protein